MIWTFKGYLSESGAPVIEEWYESLSAKEQVKLSTILEHMADNHNTDWNPNHVFPLSGYKGIYEIRFRVRNVLHRPLGCFGPNQNEFTLLIPAREQGDTFKPKGAPAIAMNRMEIIKAQKERARELSF
jgi:hypothetical protein